MAVVPGINSAALESIQDQNVRDVLKQLVNGWQMRNGQSGSGEHRFLTEADLTKAVQSSSLSTLLDQRIADQVAQQTGALGNYTPIKSLITDLQALILADPFFAHLGERIKLIDTPKTGLIDKMIGLEDGIYKTNQVIEDAKNGIYRDLKGVGLRVGGATAGYATLWDLKADAVSSSVQYTEQVKAALGTQIQAGLVNERNSRVSSDNALSEAINTIWAQVGDNTALVQNGGETVANRTGAIAQAWQQVQATLKDPATGKIISSVVGRSEFNVVNSAVTGLSAQYSVKLDAGGFVTGYGLAVDSKPGYRPTSRFYVRADRFAIGSPNDTVNMATGESYTAKIPFIVLTTETLLNGRIAPPGVYIDKAFIADGSIDSVKIGIAQIETANIKDLAVDTLKIGNNAVTIPLYLASYGGTFSPGTMNEVGSVYAEFKAPAHLVGLVTWATAGGGEHTNTRVELRASGRGVFMSQSDSVMAGFTSSHAGSGHIYLEPGFYKIDVCFGNDWSGGTYELRNWSCILLGVMK